MLLVCLVGYVLPAVVNAVWPDRPERRTRTRTVAYYAPDHRASERSSAAGDPSCCGGCPACELCGCGDCSAVTFLCLDSAGRGARGTE